MPEIKQVERIIRILQRLALSRQITVNELYNYFDQQVPKRTLQRDLIELSAADIPLMTKQGKGKELIWYLDSNYLKFIPETIGNKELLASYFLKQLATVASGTALESDIHSLLKKSKQYISPEVFQTLEGSDLTQNLFGVTFTGYINYAPHSKKIDQIINAASNQYQCHFIYKSTWKEEPSEFTADPYLLLYHNMLLSILIHTTTIFFYLSRGSIILKLAKTLSNGIQISV